MKQCPTCGKVYDDSWGICLDDNAKLVDITDEQKQTLKEILITTTQSIEGKQIKEYLGIVNGIVITGFGAFREFFAGFTDTFGGASGAYQNEYNKAKEFALNRLKQQAVKLKGNAVVGVRLDFENIGAKGKSMIMVTATGTALNMKNPPQSKGDVR